MVMMTPMVDLDDGRDGDGDDHERGAQHFLQTIFLKSYMRQKVGLENCKGKILLETFLQALQISYSL